MTNHLEQQAAQGLRSATAGRIVQQVTQFITTVLLARLLVPEDFGLLGMTIALVGFGNLFAEFGFGTALVQRSLLREDHLISAFWVMLAAGLSISSLFFLTAPAIAWFYESPPLMELARVFALSPLLVALAAVPRALLRRSLAFSQLALIEVGATVFSGVLAVILAFRGWGVWSLAAQVLAMQAFILAATFALAAWRPLFCFSMPAVREILPFSSNLTGFGAVNYWARNIDDLLVGKFIGSAGLGIYTRAYALMLLPVTQVTTVVGDVMLPVLSSMQADHPRARALFLRMVGLVAFVAFPLLAGLLVLAEPFVLALFGSQWVEIVPVLRVLCLVGIVQAVCNPVGWIYQSQGRTDLMFRWGVAATVVLIACLTAGAAVGTLSAVAWAYLGAHMLLFYPCIAIAGALIGVQTKDVMYGIAGIGTCVAIMTSGVWLIGYLLPGQWSPWLHLLVRVPFGAALYLSLAFTLRLGVVSELRDLRAARRARPMTAAMIPVGVGE